LNSRSRRIRQATKKGRIERKNTTEEEEDPSARFLVVGPFKNKNLGAVEKEGVCGARRRNRPVTRVAKSGWSKIKDL